MNTAAIGALLVGWLLTASTPPTRARTVAEYDVRFGPLRILSMHTTVAVEGQRYQAETEMQTVGVVGLLFPWKAEGSSDGRLAADHLQPLHHLGRGEYRGERRAVVIDYAEDGAVHAVSEPVPEPGSADIVPPALQQGTMDPLTASLSAVAFACRGVLPVFDGRRRYDMQLEDLGDADVPASSYGIYRGRARHCRAAIAPVAGIWRSETGTEEGAGRLDYWIASPRPDLRPLPVYLELSSGRGTLAIYLVTVEEPAP